MAARNKGGEMMQLSDLIMQAEQHAEDYGEFRIVIEASSDDIHTLTTRNVTVRFDVETGELYLTGEPE